MMKKLFSILACAMMISACSSQSVPQQTEPEKEQATVETTETSQAADGKTAVIYFSRVGNTDFDDNMDAMSSASVNRVDDKLKGNAQLMAEWLADESGSDIMEILVEDLYPVDYNETIDQAKQEQSESFRPALKEMSVSPEQYDSIYLVIPNWWGDLPMPVYSFFDQYDFSGKNITVFVTHGGSRFSSTIHSIEELEPNASVYEGLELNADDVANSETAVREWVKNQ